MIPNKAIEVVKNSEDNEDLMLCGISELHRASSEIASLLYVSLYTEDNCIKNKIGIGENNKFYYDISVYDENGKVVINELGIGYAYKKRSKYYFKRYFQLFRNSTIVTHQYSKFYFDSSLIAVISSVIPDGYHQCLYEDNSVLISTAPMLPSYIHIKNNCVLGRLEEDITNVSINDLRTAHTVKPKNPPVGSLYYDSAKDSIQVYNGTKWRTLRWEEENNEE